MSVATQETSINNSENEEENEEVNNILIQNIIASQLDEETLYKLILIIKMIELLNIKDEENT